MLWGKFTYRWDLFLSALSATNKLKEKLHDSNYFIKKIVEKNMQVSEISQPCYIILSWLTHVSTKKSMHRFSDLSNSYRDSINFSLILKFENPFEIRKGTKHSHLLLILFEALMVPLKVSLLHAYFPGSACYSFKLFFRLIQSPFLV